MYNCSGLTFVHPDILRTSQIDVLGSEFEVVAPIPVEDVRKGGTRKRPLTAALEG